MRSCLKTDDTDTNLPIKLVFATAVIDAVFHVVFQWMLGFVACHCLKGDEETV